MNNDSTWLQELRCGLRSSKDGGYDAALASFERARLLAPDRPETACALGRERMRRGDYEEACALRQVVCLPNSLRAPAYRGKSTSPRNFR